MLLSDGPMPLYFQLEKHLGERIRKREFKIGVALPSEEQLCAEYGVSRITVRRALDSLLVRKLIVRRRGVGTFISESDDSKKTVRLVGSIDAALSYTKDLSYKVLELGGCVPPSNVSSQLKIAEDETATRLELVAYLKKQPFAYSEFYFPSASGRLLRKSDVANGTPILRIIEGKMNQTAVRGSQTVTPVSADTVTAKHLGLRSKVPVLRVERTYFGARGDAMEVAVVHYHPERYTYHVDLIAGEA